MRYEVTEDYYHDAFMGESVDTADFPGLLERAAEIVEEMTMYRLSEHTFAQMPEAVKENVKKAVCAQLEYLDANGGSDVDTGAALQSASLGKFSYSLLSAGTETGHQLYAPRAMRILVPTGLLYRGGGCY